MQFEERGHGRHRGRCLDADGRGLLVRGLAEFHRVLILVGARLDGDLLGRFVDEYVYVRRITQFRGRGLVEAHHGICDRHHGFADRCCEGYFLKSLQRCHGFTSIVRD